MDSIANRMKIAMSNLKISQAELVKRTGIGKSSISTYLTGEYEPKQKNLYKIALALNVNEAWLMGLDVPMERKSATTDELERVERTVYNAFGVSRNLFNTDGNIALEKSILDDESTMRNLILQFNIFFDRILSVLNV